jgi:hypothetical protein
LETEHAARIRVKRSAYRVLMGKTEEKRPVGNLDIDGRVILWFILNGI